MAADTVIRTSTQGWQLMRFSTVVLLIILAVTKLMAVEFPRELREEQRYGYVGFDGSAIRAAPDPSSAEVARVHKGQVVLMTEDQAGSSFVKVRLPNGVEGYLARTWISRVLTETEASQLPRGSGGKQYVLISMDGDVNATPAPTTSIAKVSKWDVLVTEGQTVPNWYQVVLPMSGQRGHIAAFWVEKVFSETELDHVRKEIEARRKEEQKAAVRLDFFARQMKVAKSNCWVQTESATLRDKASATGNRLRSLVFGDEIFCTGKTEGEWSHVEWLESEDRIGEGWVLTSCVSTDDYKNDGVRRSAFLNNANVDPGIKEKILEGSIILGMTREMIRASWGNPQNIKKSVDASGVFEQWSYAGTLVYFLDGKLVRWQDR